MKCYAKSSVNLIARLANLHPKTTFFIKVFSFVFLVPEKRIIFAKVQRRIKSKIRLSYRLSFKLLVVNQSNMLHRKFSAFLFGNLAHKNRYFPLHRRSNTPPNISISLLEIPNRVASSLHPFTTPITSEIIFSAVF